MSDGSRGVCQGGVIEGGARVRGVRLTSRIGYGKGWRCEAELDVQYLFWYYKLLLNENQNADFLPISKQISICKIKN